MSATLLHVLLDGEAAAGGGIFAVAIGAITLAVKLVEWHTTRQRAKRMEAVPKVVDPMPQPVAIPTPTKELALRVERIELARTVGEAMAGWNLDDCRAECRTLQRALDAAERERALSAQALTLERSKSAQLTSKNERLERRNAQLGRVVDELQQKLVVAEERLRLSQPAGEAITVPPRGRS